MSDKRRDGAGRVASALSLPEWPLRRKLALALAIPMLLAATFGGLRVESALDEADNFSATASQVTVLQPAVAYLAAAERAIITARENPLIDDPERQSAIEEVAAAGERLEAAGADADLTPAQSEQLASTLDLSSQLRGDLGYASVGQSVSQVRQLQRSTTELIDTIINAQLRPEPRLQMLQQAIDGRVSLAMQQYQVAGGQEANPVDLAAELGVEAATLDRLAASLGSTEERVLALNQQNAAHFGTVRAGGTDLGGPEAFEQYDALTDQLLTGISSTLAASARDARTAAVVNSVITLALLLAAVLLALLVSRLLLTPIRKVREGAASIAQERLPEMVARIRAGQEPGALVPIDVTTHEEMGQLARAVDDMQRQAVRLASGEARVRQQVGDMFTTLSRRNTSLINQQLGLIERLEKDEEDPQRLESLFRLDHLASRMRRTADSLMVLADAPGAAGDQAALALGDVLQAAMAGVQEYQRVEVDTTSAGGAGADKVNGGAAADVVHLMTELVDNALAYSPPTAPVRVGTRRAGDGTLVEISDGGLGIAEDVLASLNDDLSSGGEVTPDTARRMGLLVVSRLARRHGIAVTLTRNTRGGTTASVLLPPALLQGRRLTAAPTPKPVAATPAPTPAPTLDRTAASTPDRTPARTLAPTPAPVADVVADIAAQAAPAKPVPEISLAERLGTRPPAPAPRPDGLPGLPARRVPGATLPDRPAVPAAGTSLFTKPAPAEPTRAPLPTRAAPARPPAPAPAPAPAPVAKASPEVDPIEAAINAVIRLPQRQPGATRGGRAVPGSAPTGPQGGSLFQKPARAPEPTPEPVAEPVAQLTPEPTPEPAPEPVLELAPVAPAELVEQSTQVAEVALETVVEPVEVHPAVETPVAPEPEQVHHWLEATTPAPFSAEDDSPIFRTLRSSWLTAGGTQPWADSSDNEVGAGWEVAEQVAEAAPAQRSESGLPVRRPGHRLVPGGVRTAAPAVARDPEAIRARLAAHAAGVSRGRRSTTFEESDPASTHPVQEGPA